MQKIIFFFILCSCGIDSSIKLDSQLSDSKQIFYPGHIIKDCNCDYGPLYHTGEMFKNISCSSNFSIVSICETLCCEKWYEQCLKASLKESCR